MHIPKSAQQALFDTIASPITLLRLDIAKGLTAEELEIKLSKLPLEICKNVEKSLGIRTN